MEHSRELQMDPEHMASHKWFQYLKVTPKSPQIWEENRRLVPKPAAS
jgi:nitrite reductase (cytochrome c-552)